VKRDRRRDIIAAWRKPPTPCGGTWISSSTPSTKKSAATTLRAARTSPGGAMRAAGVDGVGYGDPIDRERTLK